MLENCHVTCKLEAVMLKDAIFEENSLQLFRICFLGLACKLWICVVKNLCSNSVVGLGLYCCFDSCARIDTVCWFRSLYLSNSGFKNMEYLPCYMCLGHGDILRDFFC